MILSSDGIKEAIASGALSITPPPTEVQYTTSAVDLTLGTDFRVWNEDVLSRVKGAGTELDLGDLAFTSVATGFLQYGMCPQLGDRKNARLLLIAQQ